MCMSLHDSCFNVLFHSYNQITHINIISINGKGEMPILFFFVLMSVTTKVYDEVRERERK